MVVVVVVVGERAERFASEQVADVQARKCTTMQGRHQRRGCVLRLMSKSERKRFIDLRPTGANTHVVNG